MRHIACANEECVNHGAAYFDFEPAETIVPCPVCGKAMPSTTLERLEEIATAKREIVETEAATARETAEAEAARRSPAQPSPLERLAALPPDRVVTASDLLAILRPTEEKSDA